jgi:hypothetical protein
VTRQKKVMVVLILGGVILAWRGYSLLGKYAPSAAEATDIATAAFPTTNASVTSSTAAIAASLKKQSEVASQPWGRNPFMDVPWVVKNQKTEPVPVAVAEQAPPAPPIQFAGTSKSGEHWLAAVQGDIHRVGDVLLQEFKIIRITRHTLTLESKGWTFTYRAGETAATVIPRSEENQ